MAKRTGIAVVTELAKHICRVLATFRPAMDAAINAAVGSGIITTVQRDVLNTWLNGAQSACDIIRLVSGY